MTTLNCPVCEHELKKLDVPRHDLFLCGSCNEMVHLLRDGTVQLLGDLLERSELGDDRVRAAISKTHVSTARSFLDIFDGLARTFRMDLDAASGELHAKMAQIENRLDFAIGVFAGLDMVWDRAEEGLSALRAARDLVSTQPARNRSVQRDTWYDPAPPTKPPSSE